MSLWKTKFHSQKHSDCFFGGVFPANIPPSGGSRFWGFVPIGIVLWCAAESCSFGECICVFACAIDRLSTFFVEMSVEVLCLFNRSVFVIRVLYGLWSAQRFHSPVSVLTGPRLFPPPKPDHWALLSCLVPAASDTEVTVCSCQVYEQHIQTLIGMLLTVSIQLLTLWSLRPWPSAFLFCLVDLVSWRQGPGLISPDGVQGGQHVTSCVLESQHFLFGVLSRKEWSYISKWWISYKRL